MGMHAADQISGVLLMSGNSIDVQRRPIRGSAFHCPQAILACCSLGAVAWWAGTVTHQSCPLVVLVSTVAPRPVARGPAARPYRELGLRFGNEGAEARSCAAEMGDCEPSLSRINHGPMTRDNSHLTRCPRRPWYNRTNTLRQHAAKQGLRGAASSRLEPCSGFTPRHCILPARAGFDAVGVRAPCAPWHERPRRPWEAWPRVSGPPLLPHLLACFCVRLCTRGRLR